MSYYYYNHLKYVGFVQIAKNASTSIEPYLRSAGFKNLPAEDLFTLGEKRKFFYILRNPIERFCSGIVETYLAVNFDQNGNWGTSITQQALLALSEFSAQEFCFNLLARIPSHNSKDRKPEGNIPVNEGLGYSEDMHTKTQWSYIQNLIDAGHDTIPISMYRSTELPQILHEQIEVGNKDGLLTTPVRHLNQSLDHKKRMNDNLQKILVANKENAVFSHIWNYLQADIELWNSSLRFRYMQPHMNDRL